MEEEDHGTIFVILEIAKRSRQTYRKVLPYGQLLSGRSKFVSL